MRLARGVAGGVRSVCNCMWTAQCAGHVHTHAPQAAGADVHDGIELECVCVRVCVCVSVGLPAHYITSPSLRRARASPPSKVR